MMELPKALTALVHVIFHYRGLPSEEPSKSEIELLDSLLERASELDPEMQEMLIKFADHVRRSTQGGTGQSPN